MVLLEKLWCCSVAKSCLTICDSMNYSKPCSVLHGVSLSFTISWSLLKLISIESVMPSNHFILCHSLLLLPSIFPSIRVFSGESALHVRWPKYWSFNVSISPSNEYSGLISFRIDWLNLLAVQGTLKSLLQNHSLKASILRHSAFSIWNRGIFVYQQAGKIVFLGSTREGRDTGLIPGSGRSPAEGNSNALQCSCLGNPKHRGAWQACALFMGLLLLLLRRFSRVQLCAVANSQTRLSTQ